MAYRILLEVPEALYAEANLVVSRTPGVGITDTHKGVLGDFDNPGITMTIAAETLEVAGHIREWYDDVQRNIPGAGEVNYVLPSGSRMLVSDHSPAEVVEAIRRNQPWVDRSIPRIGEHDFRVGPADALKQPTASAEARSYGRTATFTGPRVADITILATDEVENHPSITIDHTQMLHLEMIELFRAEQAYAEVLGLQLVERADRDGRGGYLWRGHEHDPEIREIPEADFAVLQNGSLIVLMERMGRSRPLAVASNVPQPVRLLVPDADLESIRAEALGRNWTVIDETTPGVFIFRDPFGYTWSIHGESSEKEALPDA